jgi:hypothetical protein
VQQALKSASLVVRLIDGETEWPHTLAYDMVQPLSNMNDFD